MTWLPLQGAHTSAVLWTWRKGWAKIAASKAEVVVMIGTYEPCAKFIRLAHEQGFNPVFYTVSFVGAEELARRLKTFTDITVIMSQVVPPPEGPESSELLGSASEYNNLLKRYFPEDKPNFVGLEGYINARVWWKDWKGREGTSPVKDLSKPLSPYGTFLCCRIRRSHFGPNDHQGLDQVYFTRLVDGSFVLMKDWTVIKDHVEEGGAKK